jgi:hypothetical protein
MQITQKQSSQGTLAVLWTHLRPYFTVQEFRKGLSIRVTYIALQLIDCLMTVLAVNAGFDELNPVMRGMLDSAFQLIMFKIVIPLLLAWLVPSKLLIPAALGLLAVIGFNVKELLLLL